MTAMWITLLTLLLGLVASTASAQSLLQTTADAMPADSWAVLNTNGIDCTTLLECAEPGNSDNITSDAARGCWDPVLQQFHFTGQDHTNAAPPPRHVVYDAATNTWSQRALPPFGSGRVNHGWNYQACDSRGRAMYRSYFASLDVWRYSFATQTWTNIGSPPAAVASYADGFNGYSFHPEMGAAGWLIATGVESGTSGVLYRYDVASNSWARIVSNLLAGYGTYGWSEYSDIYKMTLFGSGSTMYRMWPEGLVPQPGNQQAVESSAAPPCAADIDRSGLVHNDPSTGNFVLVCGPSTASWHIYNPVTNAWTTKATPSSITNHILNFPTGGPNNPTWGVIGGPIWDHGVVFYVKCNLTACGVRLYKGGTFTAADRAYKQKCNQPGVLGCWNADSQRKLIYSWDQGSACDSAGLGTFQGLDFTRASPVNAIAKAWNGQCYRPQVDTSVKQSGLGSIKFTIPTNSGANSSGQYTEPWRRAVNGTFPYIAPGSPNGAVFYAQFYQRFDPNFQSINYQCTGGQCGGWKQMIWYGNAPNGSNSSVIESTHNNGWQRDVPQMYGQQGSDDYGVQNITGCTFQNATSQGGAGDGWASRPNYQAPLNPTCTHYPQNTWVQFTVRIEVRGASNAAASRVQMWQDGVLVIDYGNARVGWGGADGDGYGSFDALPYHTNKNSAQTHAEGYTWIDSIIVSTQPIAMGSTGETGVAPAAPTNLTVSPI